MTTPQITPNPFPTPDRNNQSQQEFSTNAAGTLNWETNELAPKVNEATTFINDKANQVASDAQQVASDKVSAQASADAAAAASISTGNYLGEYAAGLVFNDPYDYATYNKISYRVGDYNNLPYTTQGADPTAAPDAGNVVPFAELSTVNVINNIGSIPELVEFVPVANNQKVNITSYHAGWNAMNAGPQGGGVLVWDSSRPKSDHNGGSVIDPDAPFPTSWSNIVQQDAWFNSNNSGFGVWVRVKNGSYSVRDFGAVGTKTVNDTLPFKKAILAAREYTEDIYAPSGDYLINDTLFFGALTSDSVSGANSGYYRDQCLGIVGDGIGSTTIHCGTGLGGKVVLDMSGMRVKKLLKFNIQSDNDFALAPACAILTARLQRDTSGPTNNDWGDYKEVAANGKYSVAALVAASEEESMWFKCQFTNTHNDAYSAVLLTHNLQQFYTPVSNSEMPFSTGNLSNLHQRFVNCDICMRANSPTKLNTAHVRIYGSLMVEIDSPFFDSYSTNHHCVYVESGGIPFIYGIHVRNANCHEQNKAGLVLAGNNRNCSWTTNSSTGGFTDYEVELRGYTNNFTANAEYGVNIQNYVENSDIRLGSKLNVNTEYFIKNTDISCDKDTVVTTEGATENTENAFSVSRGLNRVQITGSIKDNLDSFEYAQDHVVSRNQKSFKIESDFSFMDHPLLELKRKSDNLTNIDFISAYSGGDKVFSVKENEMRLGGTVSQTLDFEIPASGSYSINLGKRTSAEIHLLLEYADNAAANIKYNLFAYNRYGAGAGFDTVEEKINGDASGDLTISHTVNSSFELVLTIASNGRNYLGFGSVNGLIRD